MDISSINKYILNFDDTKRSYPFEKGMAVYKTNNQMFALLDENKKPLRLSLKCDPKLAKLLREKYVEVMPGHNLSEKDWNTILLTGELDWQEIQGLIRHSYEISISQD